MRCRLGFTRTTKLKEFRSPKSSQWQSTPLSGRPTTGQRGAASREINWSKAPFYAYYKNFDIEGCLAPGPTSCASNPNNWWEGAAYQQLNPDQARRYHWVRMNHMIYDYCTDKARYPVAPPECVAGI
ncbi:UNVERIFIED_CONTAM: putative xyloglucan endotransglucosylase/hydrolase protein 7 [Sesamum radiatum]|uniref:Xyloglucan endotransglucosylase/hydrolase protein 7 n=1 Tax=Sesamum radiatum TaxID=300843 RepID=A0AAW2VUC1_SESRA